MGAKKTLKTSGAKLNVVAVNGCCYGRDRNPHKFPKKGLDYFKYCGQEFWAFVSGNEELYVEIIDPLGYKAKEKNEEFLLAYSQMINKFTSEFSGIFCDENGAIQWDELLRFNSSKSL